MLSCLKVKYSGSERHRTVEYGSLTAEQDTTMKSNTTSLSNLKATTPKLFHCIKSVAEKSFSHRFLCRRKTHWRYFSDSPHFPFQPPVLLFLLHEPRFQAFFSRERGEGRRDSPGKEQSSLSVTDASRRSVLLTFLTVQCFWKGSHFRWSSSSSSSILAKSLLDDWDYPIFWHVKIFSTLPVPLFQQ